ncbi:MAG: ABC transporter ATP-binding protein [Christensenellales bacterium]|jgi:multiple sugar transport system ATP-binding protein
MASLSLRNLYKVFPGGAAGDVTAVDNFNLEIEDKEFIVLVGPSGCGKSTTLRMVAGLEDITSGEMYIDGKLVNDTPPKDRDIAMVFQNYALYPHMSVYKNMAFGLKLRRLPKSEIDRRVHEAAAILSIEELLERKPNALSGGQRQRVALGRAIVREPKVFLMDEPLSNLDAKLRVQMRAEITKLHQRLQTTFIYVTHDQTEAMTMGTRIVVMKDGLLQQNDTTQNLFDYPANRFVATFIGTPQMNEIKVKLVPRDGKMFAEFNGSVLRVPDQIVRRLKSDSYIGKDVYLGVRPENIQDDAAFVEAHPEAAFMANVDMTEQMGSETYLYLKAAGAEGTLIARVDPHSQTRTGDNVRVAIEANRIHMFDAQTGETILNRA